MREPDPPGRRGRGGAGARGAEARRPPASPIHSAEPGGRGARAASSARRECGRRARAARALPRRRPPRAAPPSSHHVRPRGQRAAGRDHFGLRRWVSGAPRARGRGGGTPRRGAPPATRPPSRARVAYVEDSVRGPARLGGPRAASRLPSFYCICRAATAPSRARGAAAELAGARGSLAAVTGSQSPSALGPPRPCGGAGSRSPASASSPKRGRPPPHQFRGRTEPNSDRRGRRADMSRAGGV